MFAALNALACVFVIISCVRFLVQAISFVGSNHVGEYIFDRGTRNGKRVQSNLGAKNHGVIMPDADRESSLNAIAGGRGRMSGHTCCNSIYIYIYIYMYVCVYRKLWPKSDTPTTLYSMFVIIYSQST